MNIYTFIIGFLFLFIYAYNSLMISMEQRKRFILIDKFSKEFNSILEKYKNSIGISEDEPKN